jgi:hypothetical protein
MPFPVTRFNQGLKELKAAINEGDRAQAISLMLDLNAFVHAKAASRAAEPTLEDAIWKKGDPALFVRSTEKSIYSAAWHLWHSARIEDICAHAFINGKEQVLETKGYRRSLGVKRIDTGNSFDSREMEKFNRTIDLGQLRKYRVEVGRETRAMLKGLAIETLKRKVEPEALAEIARRGYVDPASAWLMDFWGKKKISGIVAMPLTRHLLVHLNDARRLLKIS